MITPCIKQCQLENNVCRGCKRTIEEITQWLDYTEIQRKNIINELKDR